jgi:nucleoside-diphosphate-sugar epimerase
MKILVVGASGAIGTRLVPILVGDGHDVVGTTRSPEKAERLRAMGAEPVVLDVLDAAAVRRAVGAITPDVIVHEATALSDLSSNPRRFDESFALTNRLRTEGTDTLLAAARETGVRRVIAQSFAGWPHAREGGPVKAEDAPLDPNPPKSARKSHAAIRHLEAAVTGTTGVEGVVLRYGGFYGPCTSLTRDGEFTEPVLKGRFPLIGSGAGVWSFVHIEDAAAATAAAVSRGAPGIYNVVDDQPARVSEWLPYLAELLGAKPPRHVPTWVGRLLGGELGVAMMTTVRGASNAKAKRELDWRPRYPSWREGFAEALADPQDEGAPRGSSSTYDSASGILSTTT